jgi:hypothetical protein
VRRHLDEGRRHKQILHSLSSPDLQHLGLRLTFGGTALLNLNHPQPRHGEEKNALNGSNWQL